MRTCCCTNQCPACGQCCQVGCGHRGSARGWTVTPQPNTTPLPPIYPTTIPAAQPPLEVGRTHREPLTEEQVRQIIREELERGREAS